MKFCTNCGQQLNDDAVFCTVCGTSIDAAPQQPVANQAPPVQQPADYFAQPQQQFAQPPIQQAPPVEQYQAPPVQQMPNMMPQGATPAVQLKTNRGWIKMILLTIVTLGIYPLVVWCKWSSEINITSSKYDGKKTTHFALVAFLLSWLTLGIYPLIWMTTFSSRVGNEARRRGLDTKLNGGSFWIFDILLSWTVVCPLIYLAKLCKAMNYINDSYNHIG